MQERRHNVEDDKVKEIVHQAVKEAVDEALTRIYAEIGRSIVKKIMWGLIITLISLTIGRKLVGG